MGIKLIGKLPNWVSATSFCVEMLAVQCNWRTRLEYYGPGLKRSAHGIVMSSQYGYRTRRDNFFFPSDDTTREFLKQEEREDQWIQLEADEAHL
jgi:aconitate hydratase